MTTPPRAEPRYFGPAERPRFGWLHRPAPGAVAPGVGLVICNPFGYEAICSHRSLRHFAQAAAAAGVPALRFDYDGTGDSAGDDRDPDRRGAWLKSVHDAIDELERATGVRKVCLLGVRIGAALATLAAVERDDIAGLAVIAPVVAGKPWLRELRALQIALKYADPPAGAALPEDGRQESIGFVFTAETKAELTEIDLTRAPRPPAPDVLVLDRDDLPSAAPWAERLRALGAQVDYRQVPGFADMVISAHGAVVPQAMIAELVGWLGKRAAAPATPSAAATSAATSATVAPGVDEHALFLDDDATLFGIASVPRGSPPPTRAILLLNAGAIHHIGPNRLYVALARRWAARGVLVIRMDLSGLGDSRPRAGAAENDVYMPAATSDLTAALRTVRARWKVASCRAAGLCSGGYHAFKAAVAGAPLDGVVLINPLTFFWKPGMSLDMDFAPHEVSMMSSQYKRAVLSLDKWKKLLSGGVDLRDVVQVVSRRAASLAAGRMRDVARRLGRPLEDDLGAELEAMVRRSLALSFVFAAGDPGEDLLTLHGGSVLPRLQRDGKLDIQRIAGPDHTFSPMWSHPLLTAALDAVLVDK